MEDVADLAGMSTTFIKKVVGHNGTLNYNEMIEILEQDAFAETFLPRSCITDHLMKKAETPIKNEITTDDVELIVGDATKIIKNIANKSVNCIVTSTPYWGMRLYDDMHDVHWEDGETCPLGMEQTPEGFVRHTIQILHDLKRVLTQDGSIWWNIMDTYNTRTQIRNNAAEALRAMQGKDSRSWGDYDCRRYSAGHSYLKDGEQCLIPMKIAERASRIGYHVKTVISWTKTGSMPEPQNSRVSRNIEYILHLTLDRTPKFEKENYRTLPPRLGGRNIEFEPDKLTDFWALPTSAGKDGHGAQFPLALPGRCIGVTTVQNDLVLDPFMGAGTTAMAARMLARRFIGIDISKKYVDIAKKRIQELQLDAFSGIKEKRPKYGD
jgi:DNA modification methylase